MLYTADQKKPAPGPVKYSDRYLMLTTHPLPKFRQT